MLDSFHHLLLSFQLLLYQTLTLCQLVSDFRALCQHSGRGFKAAFLRGDALARSDLFVIKPHRPPVSGPDHPIT